MLNKGVLGLHVPFGPFKRAPLLTTTVVWNLSWCLLDPMFDERFRIRPEFLRDGTVIAQRFRVMAVVNALLTPFLLVFMTMHYFLSNMERFYHHPKHIGAILC
jgi:autophagy-related protein 9